MAINEAYNVDCIEYMRTLPDEYFDLAVCDPPYGSGNDTKLGGQKVRRNIRPVLQTGAGSRADGERSITTLRNGGGRTVRRKIQKILQAGTGFKEERGRQGTVFLWGGCWIRGSHVGYCTTTGIFRWVVPGKQESDYMGRKLLFAPSHPMFSCLEEDEYCRGLFYGHVRICVDFF